MMNAEQLADLWYETWCTEEMTFAQFDIFEKNCLDNGVDSEEVVSIIMSRGA